MTKPHNKTDNDLVDWLIVVRCACCPVNRPLPVYDTTGQWRRSQIHIRGKSQALHVGQFRIFLFVSFLIRLGMKNGMPDTRNTGSSSDSPFSDPSSQSTLFLKKTPARFYCHRWIWLLDLDQILACCQCSIDVHRGVIKALVEKEILICMRYFTKFYVSC